MSNPGSFASGAVPGEEEYLELSDFLGAQRTKYDELRTTYREKQRVLKALEAECEHLARITHLNDTSTDVFRDQSLALNRQLEEIRARTEDGAHRSAVDMIETYTKNGWDTSRLEGKLTDRYT